MSTPERAIVDAAIAYIAALDYFNAPPGWGTEKEVRRVSTAHKALETAVRKLIAEPSAPAPLVELSAIADTPCDQEAR